MEPLIKEQKNLAGEMAASFLSYTKNPARKSIPAIQTRLAKMNDLWTDFEDNNQTLIQNLATDHDYIINNVFQDTKDSYDITIEKLERDLAELVALENSGNATSNITTVVSTSATTSARAPETTLSSNPGQPSNEVPVTIATPWSNISIWSPPARVVPTNPGSTTTNPWLSTTGTVTTNPSLSTTMTYPQVTLPTYTTSSYTASSASSNTLGSSASNPNIMSSNLHHGNINSTSTTMANFNGTTWGTQPNHQFAVPHQQFGAPNHQFGVPHQQFGAPNHQLGAPNHQFGAPNHQFMWQNPQHTSHNQQFGNMAGSMNYAHPYNLPKLQPLTISKFDGCIKKWSVFSDLFRTIIHNNIGLQSIQKMQYLIGYLEGEPARIIQHLNLSDNNYLTAIDLLRERYDNPRKMLENYISTILDLKKVEFRSAKDMIVLADTIKECLAAISNLNYNIRDWDPIIVTIAVRKLDHESIRLFEESLTNQKTMPTLTDLYRFLERRYQVLETTKKDGKNAKDNSKKVLMVSTESTGALPTTKGRDPPTCKMCKEAHRIQHCEKFKQLTTKDRSELVNKLKICVNCLQHEKGTKCKSKRSCQHCGKKHHSLIHYGDQEKGNRTSNEQTIANIASITEGSEPVTINMISKAQKSFILLATAIVRVKTIFNEWELMRIVLDLGSQGTFITENAAQRLGLPRQRFITPLKALGDISAGNSMTKMDFEIQPRFQSNFRLRVSNAIIITKIVQDLPGRDITKLTDGRYRNLLLADPNYEVNGPIDILINAEVYGDILKKGLVKGKPTAQNTELGWILFGAVPEIQNTQPTALNTISMISTTEIDQNMRKFWQMEKSAISQTSDELCELHYKKTHSRDQDGRYIVRLPFKENNTEIGDTKSRAVMRFYHMEKKMKKNDHDFGAAYHRFVQEYYNLGHMKEVTKGDNHDTVYYLPHHAVTPKFRVVFDGSCKPKNGLSLNEALHTGPKLQQSLVEILNRWRTYRYVLTADIEKMFRQIKVDKRDQPYQRIWYRSRPDVPLQEFQLLTVTYGTACATFLAVRTLLQLAKDEGDDFPRGKIILQRDLYVDDMMTGGHTFEETLDWQKQISELTRRGGFNLRKWASNKKELLRDIPVESRAMEIHEIKDEDSIKTLGIHWSPLKDEFSFKIRAEVLTERQLTKRDFLSIISSIYDPIGWLSPFTVKTKIMMQKLWEPEIKWDTKIPMQVQREWNKICTEIKLLERIFIPRWIHYQPTATTQIHGFCDASADAYSAVLYSRITINKTVKITLLTAKTRVTPLKMDKNENTTIPRLELCGALLLAELLQETLEKSDIEKAALHTWSDSTTALNWIFKNSSNDRFISNRTKQIRQLTDPEIWKYVPGEENPADCASRGINPKQLLEHKLWWNGPSWLSLDEEHWPKQNIRDPVNEKVSLATISYPQHWLTVTKKGKCWDLLTAYSELRKLTRVLAYSQRFLNNASKNPNRTGFLTADELESTRMIIFKQIQSEGFVQELRNLQLKKPLQKTSKLLPLSPFLDELGLIRVGGRLKNSALSTNQKHPIILPKNHHMAYVIIREAHHKTLHGGRQLTTAHLQEQFWIMGSTRMIQSVIRQCITCFKQRPKISEQLMGNLPRDRVIQSPPFSHSGVDYTGEFHVRVSKGRGTKTYKAYVCLFVCMATEAIHLELASDASAAAFLAAYKRFTGKRGCPKEIFSDNGGNFVAGDKKLDQELQIAIKEATATAAELTANDGTNWYFNPPRSAHFGGLFEAGIKSIKKHLKAVLSETSLTFEEFTTVLAQVEACVNSRPITPLSKDPKDLEALTPGHFLIGRPLLNPPEADQTRHQTLTDRWRLLTKLKQDIWNRWSREYLHTLQQRPKWREERENLKVGELVLIKEDHIPPTRWPLGRIQEIVKGNDGKVRVVHVSCKGKLDKNNRIIHQILPRGINRICPLPLNEKDDDDLDPQPSEHMSHQKCVAPSTSEATEIKINLLTTTHKVNETQIDNDRLEWEDRLNSRNPRKRDNEQLHKLVQRFKSASTKDKRRKVTITPPLWYTITLLVGLILSIQGHQDFENKKLEPGLYVETAGSCQLLKGNLRLEFRLNGTDIAQDEINLNHVFSETEKLCATTENIRTETQCESLVHHLQQQIRMVADDINKIKAVISTRKRRGLLGRILQGVFGVNDEVYTDINALNTNQQILENIMSTQNLRLSIHMNQTDDLVTQSLTHFNKKLREVIDKINEMNSWYVAIDMNSIAIRILSTYIAASNFVEETQTKYIKLTKILLDHGNILDIIDMATIHRTIESATSKLPSNMVISQIPQQRVQQAKSNGTLKIFAFMDIIDTRKYEILHVTPIPMANGNNTFTVPIIPFNTIAINYNDQTYFIPTEAEYKNGNEDGSLCNPSIISNLETNPNCVIDELYERKTKQQCKLTRFSLENVIWKQMVKQNTWLYIASNDRSVAIICQGERNDIQLHDVGILKLNNDCTVKTKWNSLRFHTNRQQGIYKTFF